ncbi:MAG: serine/threonine-protein kinase [Chthoniobacteraceae bacterium]
MVLPGQVAEGGTIFGRYRLARELGRGGFGVVWQARDEELGIDVALKFLPDLVARDAEAVEDLKREIRRGLRLTHPGIVRVHNFIREGDLAAIAMEFIDGTTLRQRKIDAPGRCLDVDDLRPLVAQLGDVLTYVHEVAMLVHRDIKPGNLMVASTGEMKVADFGIASSLADSLTRMTNAPASSGTLAYMSPQQARGDAPAVTDDIYALGATLYELLTGKPPFYRGNIALQAYDVIAPPMSERRIEFSVEGKQPIPPEWERAIAACLAKEPAARPQSVRELRGMLLDSAPSAASREDARLTLPAIGTLAPPLRVPEVERSHAITPPPPPARRRSAWPLVLGAAALVALCGWLGWRLAEPGAAPGPVKPSRPALAPRAAVTADSIYREGLAFENATGRPLDAAKAAASYQRAVELGHVPATARLARLLNYGWGVREDETRALKLAEEAAAKGDPVAANLAAVILAGQRYSGPELTRAIGHLERAAGGGYALAMLNLADYLRNGRGVAKDETRAEDLSRRAMAKMQADAAEGQAEAHFWIGWARSQGRGVPLDLQAAVRDFEAGAKLGHPRSMVALADAYAGGIGVAEDDARAIDLYRRAAETGWLDALLQHAAQLASGNLPRDARQAKSLLEQAITAGSSDALWKLGELLVEGDPLVRDEKRALALFRQSADAGDSEAWWRLGVSHEFARGTAKDAVEAMRCYARSAADGNRIGQLYVGRCHRYGIGTPPDAAKAREWIERSVAAGLFAAMCELGEMLREGIGGAKDVPRSAKLFAQAANGGVAVGQFHYAYACETGLGVDKDEAQAVAWYEKAVAQNLPAAQTNLGTMLMAGRGAPKNLTRGFSLIRAAADAGNATGQMQLGYCYESGRGVAKNDREAFAWFERAAQLGLPGAQLQVGWYLHNGTGCTRDYAAARGWYEKAATQELPGALNNLGVLYAGGLGVKASRTKAIEYYRRAAAGGDANAAKNLRSLGVK